MDISGLHKLYLKSGKVSTDTRKISKGTIFFALKGTNFDGNAFALDALEKGASFAVVDNPQIAQKDDRLLLFDSVLDTLQKLALFHRKFLNIPVIAVTGSNGKTTTKELLHRVLSTQYKTAVTKGNFNNHIGVPLTLLDMKPEDELAIVEMGDNHRGEVAELCKIALPTHGFVTNIGKDHLEGFGNMEENFKAKKEVFDFLSASAGIAFVNSRHADIVKASGECKNRIFYGKDGDFACLKFAGSDPFVCYLDESGRKYRTGLFGEYNFENIETAYTIGKYFHVPEANIHDALTGYVSDNNRSQVMETEKNLLLLDAYNANPSSVEVALKSLAGMETEKKKIAILGDMFELGDFAADEHQRIVDLGLSFGNIGMILVGKQYTRCDTGSSRAFETLESAEEYLNKNAPEGAVILLKGSRGMRLETLVPYL